MSPPQPPIPRFDLPSASLCQALAGRYEPLRLLGGGGEASVWLARDLQNDREVALKCCAPRPGRRALHELASLLALRHPCIVPLRDFCHLASGEMILVSDYVPGGSLREKVERGPLPLEQVIAVADDVLQALVHLHSLGLVHRDIKPDNILVAPRDQGGDIHLLADFGIAGPVDDPALDDGVVGSAAYLAPENYSRRAGPAGDLYSLGVTLYELATGRRPFEGEGAALARSHLASPPPPLTRETRMLEPFIHALLRKEARERPVDAGAALEMLHALRPGSERRAPSAPTRPRPPTPLAFGPTSRLVVIASFHLPGEHPSFDLTTLGDRPHLVLDHGSHLALHDAANGASSGIVLPKSGPAHRLDHPGLILRCTAHAAVAWDTARRTETVIAELSRPCGHFAWHEASGRFASVDGQRLRIEGASGPTVNLRLPDGHHATRLVWLNDGATLAVSGGQLRPEICLYSPAGELRNVVPLRGTVIDIPRHNGAPIWLLIDHAEKNRFAAMQLSPGGGHRDLLLPDLFTAHAMAIDGLLILTAQRELLHVSDQRGHLPLGSLHPETTALALSADSRHLLATRRSTAGTTFTLYSHQHG